MGGNLVSIGQFEVRPLCVVSDMKLLPDHLS